MRGAGHERGPVGTHPRHGFSDLVGDVADSKLTDRDLMIYALKAGYGGKGARIGSRDGESELFRADMLAFWQRTLG